MRDVATVLAASDGENLRFKPFASYTISNSNPGNGVDQTFLIGANGPVTDQLNFIGHIGLFSQARNLSLLWRLGFLHIAGPNTRESLDFGRTTDTFNQETPPPICLTVFPKLLGRPLQEI